MKPYIITKTAFDAEEYDREKLHNWEQLVVVTSRNSVALDLMTECKSAKTAVRRFFREISKLPESIRGKAMDWNCVDEHDFIPVHDFYRDEEGRIHAYSCGLEWHENYGDDKNGNWYIWLNLSGGHFAD